MFNNRGNNIKKREKNDYERELEKSMRDGNFKFYLLFN